MNKCTRCGENNPAEVHICTPGGSIDKNKEIIEDYEKRKLKIMF